MADTFTISNPSSLNASIATWTGQRLVRHRAIAVVESCTDLARMALDDALLLLSETLWAEPESWRWGDRIRRRMITDPRAAAGAALFREHAAIDQRG